MASAALPAHAALLRDFANTVDVSEGIDTLTTPSEVTGWLHARGLLPSDADETGADDADVALARDLREAVRAAFRANHDASPTPAEPVPGHLGARLPLALEVRGGRPLLSPLESGVPGALTRLLVAAADAGADGTWRRLKICAADDCSWAFYDASKNQSRTWCSMQECGNRMKTRSYRARRAGRPDHGASHGASHGAGPGPR
jgi:predicted RNA-binding Zn ribbon-like protein